MSVNKKFFCLDLLVCKYSKLIRIYESLSNRSIFQDIRAVCAYHIKMQWGQEMTVVRNCSDTQVSTNEKDKCFEKLLNFTKEVSREIP